MTFISEEAQIVRDEEAKSFHLTNVTKMNMTGKEFIDTLKALEGAIEQRTKQILQLESQLNEAKQDKEILSARVARFKEHESNARMWSAQDKHEAERRNETVPSPEEVMGTVPEAAKLAKVQDAELVTSADKTSNVQ